MAPAARPCCWAGRCRAARFGPNGPGSPPAALQDGRDQPPRTDLRALFKGLLAEQMGVSLTALNSSVFPDSGGVKPLCGLIRA